MGWVIPKGKYKGYDIDEINDRSYCQFMLDNWQLTILEEQAIRNAMTGTSPGKVLNQKLTPGTQFITPADVKKVFDYMLKRVYEDYAGKTFSTDEFERTNEYLKNTYKILTGKDYVS